MIGRTPRNNSAGATLPLARRYEVTNFPRNSGSNGAWWWPLGAATLWQRRVAIELHNALLLAKLRIRVKYWQDRLTSTWKTTIMPKGAEARTNRVLALFNIAMAIQLSVNSRPDGPLNGFNLSMLLLGVYVAGFSITGVLHLICSMHWPQLSLMQTIGLRRSAYTASFIVTIGWTLLTIVISIELGGVFGAVYPWFLLLYFKVTAFQTYVPYSDKRSRANLRKEIRRDRG